MPGDKRQVMNTTQEWQVSKTFQNEEPGWPVHINRTRARVTCPSYSHDTCHVLSTQTLFQLLYRGPTFQIPTSQSPRKKTETSLFFRLWKCQALLLEPRDFFFFIEKYNFFIFLFFKIILIFKILFYKNIFK